ncbi:MAG: type III-B CRISPR module RAMP protein Cmr4 [Peptococcaceae bacterium]|nr:MAG: type III-B CRISPR module RAMP protein Cmr4 [Peptococcaceae bacterium]
MYNNAQMMILYTQTPLHPGTGQSTGVIDLPVQRERHTRHPVIQASSLKGSLKSFAMSKAGSSPNTEREIWRKKIAAVFGPDDGDLHGGALTVMEARLLAFPVRSLQAPFFWITCPLILQRLQRDLAAAGHKNALEGISFETGEGKARCNIEVEPPLILEDLTFEKCGDATQLTDWLTKHILPCDGPYKFYNERFKKYLLILSDQDFAYLVENATTVNARIVLDDKKTSQNLWYEETLPPDCLFYTWLLALNPRDGNQSGLKGSNEVLSFVTKELSLQYLQLGGNETVGQGWCHISFPAFELDEGGKGE